MLLNFDCWHPSRFWSFVVQARGTHLRLMGSVNIRIPATGAAAHIHIHIHIHIDCLDTSSVLLLQLFVTVHKRRKAQRTSKCIGSQWSRWHRVMFWGLDTSQLCPRQLLRRENQHGGAQNTCPTVF